MFIRGKSYTDRPPRGDTARRGARRGDPLNRPPDREQESKRGPNVSGRFERYEGPATEQTLADTDAVIFRFSGYPDAIDLTARAFPAMFTLQDFLGHPESPIIVQVGQTVRTNISRPVVVARNAIAGSNALVGVTGKWHEPAERD